MISNFLRLKLPVKDDEFDLIYPKYLREMSEKHFTEVDVAIKASELLITEPGLKVLDIGSGVGKFCFIAGAYTEAAFTGVDYRKQFIDLCDNLTIKHNFKNVNFIHSDILDVDFKEYDHFYFFNSFEEHANLESRMDNSKDTSTKKFLMYSQFVREQFDQLPVGTKIVTYYAYANQIPNSYELESVHFDGTLKYWIKKHKSYKN